MKRTGKPLSLRGRRFGMLVVARRAPNDGKRTAWLCICDCGQQTVTRGSRLTSGHAKTCGKGHKIKSLIRTAAPSEYNVWQNMLGRCYRTDHVSYKNYGARGVKVCARWRQFENFLSDMGPRPSRDYSIDRYPDRAGNYELGNCRWATRRQQALNTRRTIYVMHEGEQVPLTELIERLGLNRDMVRKRIKLGWDLETALTAPSNKGKTP